MTRDLTRIVTEGFKDAFDRFPAGVWSAPGRVNVMGDHTDDQDGLTFAFAIGPRTAVALAPRSDGRITVATDLTADRAEADLATINPDSGMDDWKAYPLGMIWAVLEYARANPPRASRALPGGGTETETGVFVGTGLDVFLTTDVSIGAGLASSASTCAAIGTALNDTWALGLKLPVLAELGRRTENRAAGAATGIADHVTVLAAKAHKDVFFDARGADVSLIDVPDMASAGLVSVVVDTRESHRNWSTVFTERRASCDRAASLLGCQKLRELRPAELDSVRHKMDDETFRRARHVVTEIARTLELTRTLRTEGPAHVGPILDASQASLRDDFEVSTPRIDFTVELAKHLGAKGARMTGSGLGGSVHVLHPADRVDELRDALVAAYAERGWEKPDVFVTSSHDGAKRDA